jgi:acyl-CoA ligase (AMP-forming) (exosortase A-associated)
MGYLLHHIVSESRQRTPDAPALLFKKQALDYAALDDLIASTAAGLAGFGVRRDQRVAVYLPKQVETVATLFGTMAAGGIFVPVNPILKPEQVGHILRDCTTGILVTSADRARVLVETLRDCPDLTHLVIVGDGDVGDLDERLPAQVSAWQDMLGEPRYPAIDRIDADVAAILYTSGSTGRPKGVVLSHRNMLTGAHSVATYLENSAQDRLLAVLPFSFDYGLSQLTTAFLVGASVVLMDYLLPRDVIRAVARHGVTGLAAVPPLWNQLASLPWPDEARDSLRYITNSGGAMPVATTTALQEALPLTAVYLMYGLTEAFRSTYLPPDQVASRPESMGKAIPNAEIMVVRPDGSECDVDEPGELVHRGALVALGYWNDPVKTDTRFKPAPGQPRELPNPELAVWSGDQVRRDAEGYLYFIGRDDEMIKTSGYRVSPAEVEEIVFQVEAVEQAVVFGAPHDQLGYGIVLVIQGESTRLSSDDVLAHCRVHLPLYMLPGHIHITTELPRNPNGKIDRKSLSSQFQHVFTSGNADS